MPDVTVTVSDAYADHIDDVAQALRDQGMQVSQVLSALGMISGSAPSDREQSLKAVEGVEAVEKAMTFQLPPPDSPIQ
jgi:hypothetical protein